MQTPWSRIPWHSRVEVARARVGGLVGRTRVHEQDTRWRGYCVTWTLFMVEDLLRTGISRWPSFQSRQGTCM